MKNHKKVIVLAGVVVLAVSTALLISNALSFRLTGTNAKDDVIASSSSSLILEFNQPLDPNIDTTTKNIFISRPNKISSVSISNNTIVFTINNDTSVPDITIKITSVTSQDGDEIQNLERTFTFEYVDFSKLSKDEQQRQIDESSSSEPDYPIIKDLPIITDKYNIDYQMPTTGSDKLIILIDVLSISENYEPDQETIDYIKQIRSQAIQAIIDKGYAIEDYTLDYTDSIPEDFS